MTETEVESVSLSPPRKVEISTRSWTEAVEPESTVSSAMESAKAAPGRATIEPRATARAFDFIFLCLLGNRGSGGKWRESPRTV